MNRVVIHLPSCLSATNLWLRHFLVLVLFTTKAISLTRLRDVVDRSDFSQGVLQVNVGQPSNFVKREVSVPGVAEPRSYNIVSPKSAGLELNGKRPAILMFHGYGSDGRAFASEGDMRLKGPLQGYIIAYLSATPRNGSKTLSKERVWNSGSNGDFALQMGVDDVNYAASVREDLIQQLKADPERIYLVGQSAGGSMALRVACEKPEFFAGAAIIHGSLEFRDGNACADSCSGNGAARSCSWDTSRKGCREEDWETLPKVFECDGLLRHPMPLYFMNGMANAWNAGGVGSTGSFPPLDYMSKYFSELYRCGSGETKETNGTRKSSDDITICTSYDKCTVKSTLMLCQSQEGGDWWYGQPYDMVSPCLYKGGTEESCEAETQLRNWGPMTASVHLTEEILKFFKKGDL